MNKRIFLTLGYVLLILTINTRAEWIDKDFDDIITRFKLEGTFINKEKKPVTLKVVQYDRNGTSRELKKVVLQPGELISTLNLDKYAQEWEDRMEGKALEVVIIREQPIFSYYLRHWDQFANQSIAYNSDYITKTKSLGSDANYKFIQPKSE